MEGELRIIEVREGAREAGHRRAEALRAELKRKGVLLINLMSAPGSGKTSAILALLGALRDDLRIGVLEADIDADTDARAVAALGVPAVQLHTGGLCHLDAEMCAQGLAALPLDRLDLVVLENVGNLVCPAEFDTGAGKNVMLLSVPEGDDKPLKYPLMFQVSDLLLITKTDVLPYFDFDPEKARLRAEARNPGLETLAICAKTGAGVSAWANWVRRTVADWKSRA